MDSKSNPQAIHNHAGNSTKKTVGRPIQKGQVLNPTGRPKLNPSVKAMLKDMTPEAVEELAKIMRNPMTKDADRLRAIEQILDRSLGKPVQQVNADVTTLTPILFDPSLAMLVRSDDADDADE